MLGKVFRPRLNLAWGCTPASQHTRACSPFRSDWPGWERVSFPPLSMDEVPRVYRLGLQQGLSAAGGETVSR